MKKLLSVVLLIMMLSSVIFTAVGCGDDEADNNSHTHVYVDGICNCGETDPNYRACDMCLIKQGTHPIEYSGYTYYLCESCYEDYTHEHVYVEGKCECGDADPDYGKLSFSSATVDTAGNLTVTLSDGSTFPAVALPENPDGIKFTEAEIKNRSLVIKFSDGYMVTCVHTNFDLAEITSLGARIENKRLYFSVNDTEKDLGQVFYPTMPLTELTPSGACEYADTRDTFGRDITYVAIKVKGYGTITVLLDATTAPITVANFLSLVNSGFYNGLTFHRVMSNFMIQGGDPNGDGTGGSGTNIFGEFADNEWANDILHKRGVISMARNGVDKNSASSQFFICNADSHTSLDGRYAAFGYVISGMNIIDEITALSLPYTDTYYGTNIISDKNKQVVIESITVVDYPVPPEHEHSFVEGKCECGETDPDYVPSHTHNFVEGKCECGETDPSYNPNAGDTYYDPDGWTRPDNK